MSATSAVPQIDRFHAHWHTLLPLAPPAAAAGLLTWWAGRPVDPTAAGLLLLAAALAWAAWTVAAVVLTARWLSTSYEVTGANLVRQHGVVHRRRLAIPLTEIAAVHCSQRLAERLLGYGDVTIETAGDTNQVLTDIPRPREFVERLDAARAYARFEQLQADRHQPALFDLPAAAPSAGAPAAQQRREAWSTVARLGQLVDDGVLDRDLFDQAMADLLG